MSRARYVWSLEYWSVPNDASTLICLVSVTSYDAKYGGSECFASSAIERVSSELMRSRIGAGLAFAIGGGRVASMRAGVAGGGVATGTTGAVTRGFVGGAPPHAAIDATKS